MCWWAWAVGVFSAAVAIESETSLLLSSRFYVAIANREMSDPDDCLVAFGDDRQPTGWGPRYSALPVAVPWRSSSVVTEPIADRSSQPSCRPSPTTECRRSHHGVRDRDRGRLVNQCYGAVFRADSGWLDLEDPGSSDFEALAGGRSHRFVCCRVNPTQYPRQAFRTGEIDLRLLHCCRYHCCLSFPDLGGTTRA